MTPAREEADLVVIGSGQGGVPLAATLAQRGRRVVLFDAGPLGGTCINVGCTPSKTLLAAAHAAGRARNAAAIGVRAAVAVDGPAVFARVRRVRDAFRAEIGRKLAAAGVEVVTSDVRFVGEREVEGGGRRVRGAVVVIDAGGRPNAPPIAGLEATPYLTSDTFFDLPDVPRSLAVIGGGYIGLELGQGARRLGSEVTIVHPAERVLDREEPDATAVLQDALLADGVRLELGTQPASVAAAKVGVDVTLTNGKHVTADVLLVATGRRPNTAALELDASGIACTPAGYVVVDDYLQTACPNVYAIGDVAGQPAFTHVSWEDHRRILSTLDGVPRKRNDRVLSYTTFTEPQLGRTGMTLAQAQAAGIDARAVTLPLSNVARGIEWGLEQGFFRLVVDRDGKILGATFAGYEAGELIHVIVALIEAGATWQVLARAMFVHPTFAEGLPTLARLLA
jgi:pyruvate/2-oxoglutarate dehydrogenase complex dihydrolipoamide dehydrogenase (E3) component